MWIHCIFQPWVPRRDFFLWSSAAWNTLQTTAAFPTPYSTWRELAERVLATSNQAPLAPRLPRCLSHLTTREPGNSFSFTENCKFTGKHMKLCKFPVIAAIKSLRVANPQLFWSSHFKPHDDFSWWDYLEMIYSHLNKGKIWGEITQKDSKGQWGCVSTGAPAKASKRSDRKP